MSIATLKKKTNQKYNSMSVGRKSFSINGTHRSQGFVGQNLISRSLPTTKMRGNTVCGHGGHLGSYHTPPNIVSGINYQNDPTYIKSSVLSTTGMIMTKHRWIRRPYSFSTVKSNSTNHNNNQSDIINRNRLLATTDSITIGGDVSLLPLPFTSSVCGVCNFSGNGTQNGIYTVSQSSGIGYNAFNGSTIGWISNLNYDITTLDAYGGTSGIIVQNHGKISGEWLQLRLPATLGQLFKLTQYSISPIVSEFNTGGNYDLNFDSSPSEWYVLGSINGNTWFSVDHQVVGTYWSDQHLLGKPILPRSFSIKNSSTGYVYYTIIFVSNSACYGTYPNTTTFNSTYVGIQNVTYNGSIIQKGLTQSCSVVNKDCKVNINKLIYNVTKNPLPTISQSNYISKLQKVCISTDVSDLRNNTCTPGF